MGAGGRDGVVAEHRRVPAAAAREDEFRALSGAGVGGAGGGMARFAALGGQGEDVLEAPVGAGDAAVDRDAGFGAAPGRALFGCEAEAEFIPTDGGRQPHAQL